MTTGPQWVATGSLHFGRVFAQVVPLVDGRVLVFGGNAYPADPSGANETEIFTFASQTWSEPPATSVGEPGEVAVRLADGRVLVGAALADCTGFTTAIYDPVASSWTATANTNFMHVYGQLFLLQSGKVLLAGGSDCQGYPEPNAELYDVAANTWTPAGFLPDGGRVVMGAVELQDGRVLFAGGGCCANDAMDTSEIYDPIANSWSYGPTMTAQRRSPGAAMLPDGRVLVVGGEVLAPPVTGLPNTFTILGSAEVFDPSTNAFTAIAPLPSPHAYPSMTVLADGRVLVAGGAGSELQPEDVDLATADAALFDPSAMAWTVAPQMLESRMDHVAALLPNGKVIVATGTSPTFDTVSPLASAEIFSPDCTTSAQCGSGGTCVDGFCCDSPCTGSCMACSAAKKGSGANGWCGPVGAGLDPDDDCPAQGPATCGNVGGCNGAGACSLFPAGTTCVAAVCNGNTAVGAQTCNGAGTCQPATSQACGTLVCSNGACVACQHDADCPTGDYCSAGNCEPQESPGATCASSDQCSTGYCADGVCCDGPCAADGCHACAAAHGATTNGQCTALSGIACNDGNMCTTGDQCQAGVCTASGVVTCAAPGPCHEAGTCNPTSGTCSNPTSPDGTPCDDGNSCTTVDTCIAGTCTGGHPVVCSSADCGLPSMCNPASGQCEAVADAASVPCEAPTCEGGRCEDAGPMPPERDSGQLPVDASPMPPDAGIPAEAGAPAGCACNSAGARTHGSWSEVLLVLACLLGRRGRAKARWARGDIAE